MEWEYCNGNVFSDVYIKSKGLTRTTYMSSFKQRFQLIRNGGSLATINSLISNNGELGKEGTRVTVVGGENIK